MLLRKSVIALCLLATHAHAMECDRSIAPVPTVDGYRSRGTPEHCEGMYVSTVSGPALELVSLTYGKPFERQRPPTKLTLSAPERSPNNAPLHLRATGIPAGLYFRLDADVAPSTTFDWHADDILGKRGITLYQVGLFAFTSNGYGEQTFTPVRIETDPDEASEAGRAVYAIMRPLVPLARASWRFVARDGTAGAWLTQTSIGDRVVIKLAVPVNVMGGSLQLAWDDPGTGARKVKYFDIAF